MITRQPVCLSTRHNMKKMRYVIIVAGGKGLRMGADIPKQFLPVGGQPVLMRTILAFREFDPGMKVILVLPRHQQEYWKELCAEYSFREPFAVADGGETRFHSVKNGLALIPDDAEGVVGVHDGVRPFPSKETISRVYDEAERTGAAVPVVPVVDTLRHIEGGDITEGESKTVSRNEYRIVQTPQTFGIRILKDAYRQEYSDFFTDDASVVEHAGHAVSLVEGNRENIKITTPFDLAVAEAMV